MSHTDRFLGFLPTAWCDLVHFSFQLLCHNEPEGVTIDTVKKDKLIETHPCFIRVKGKHNHSTETAIGFRQLRALPNTTDEFFKYFE